MNLTDDQKSHITTQAERDTESFTGAFRARIKKTQQVDLTQEDARYILAEVLTKAITGTDRSNKANARSASGEATGQQPEASKAPQK